MSPMLKPDAMHHPWHAARSVTTCCSLIKDVSHALVRSRTVAAQRNVPDKTYPTKQELLASESQEAAARCDTNVTF